MSLDAMKLALEALENPWGAGAEGVADAIIALRAAIEQPRQWQGLAQPDAYGYASRLAVAIWEQHYKDVAPQWKPLDDLRGVLPQIDNMTVGLTRLAQPEQEPVAVIGNWGRVEWLDGVHPQLGDKMYSAPPRREWVGLTDEDVDEVERWIAFKEDGSGRIPTQKLVRYIERKLKEKNT